MKPELIGGAVVKWHGMAVGNTCAEHTQMPNYKICIQYDETNGFFDGFAIRILISFFLNVF